MLRPEVVPHCNLGVSETDPNPRLSRILKLHSCCWREIFLQPRRRQCAMLDYTFIYRYVIL
jgi:hypothetical protein